MIGYFVDVSEVSKMLSFIYLFLTKETALKKFKKQYRHSHKIFTERLETTLTIETTCPMRDKIMIIIS